MRGVGIAFVIGIVGAAGSASAQSTTALPTVPSASGVAPSPTPSVPEPTLQQQPNYSSLTSPGTLQPAPPLGSVSTPNPLLSQPVVIPQAQSTTVGGLQVNPSNPNPIIGTTPTSP